MAIASPRPNFLHLQFGIPSTARKFLLRGIFRCPGSPGSASPCLGSLRTDSGNSCLQPRLRLGKEVLRMDSEILGWREANHLESAVIRMRGSCDFIFVMFGIQGICLRLPTVLLEHCPFRLGGTDNVLCPGSEKSMGHSWPDTVFFAHRMYCSGNARATVGRPDDLSRRSIHVACSTHRLLFRQFG